MRLPKQWLSILSVNSIFLFNLGFPLLTLPTTLHRGEVIAQTDPNAEAERLHRQGRKLFQQGTAESLKQAIPVYEKALQLYQQAESLTGQAVSSLGLGRIHDLLGDKQQALEYYNQSLSLFQKVGLKAGVASILNNIGRIYNDLGEKQQALEYYNQSLPLSQQLGDIAAEATTLNSISRVYNDLGDKQQALDYYNQSLPLSQQLGDIAAEATTLHNIGAVYNDLGEKQQALEYYNQSLPLSQQLGDKREEAVTLTSIGRIYDALGDKQKALEYFNQSLPLSQQMGDKSMEAITLNNIGRIYNDLGEKQQALEYYNQSLPLSQQLRDIAGEATTLKNIGRIYNDLGEKQQALEYYNQSLPLSRQVGDKEQEAAILHNIGRIYNDLGEKQQALEYYNQSLPLSRQVKYKPGEATTLTSIGVVYNDLGEKQQALDYYNQSLPLSRQLGDIAGEATTLTNIGAVYDALGEKQQALDYYNQSLLLSRQVGYKTGVAATLHNIGWVYNTLGEKQKALEYYNQSLPLSRQVGNIAGVAATLTNIGLVYDDLGDQQKALEYYNQSLSLRQQVEDKVGVANTLHNIGAVYNTLGEKQKALEYYNQSLPLSRQVGNKAGVATTLFNFASLKRSQANLTEALTDIESAINIIEELRTKIISQDLRTTYFSTVYGYYEFYIDLLMELHEQNPNQGYDTKALHASERGRARSLLDILAESGANIKEGVDPQLLAEEQKLLQRLNALDQSRQLNPGEIDIEELKQEIETVRRQLQNLEVEIKRNSPQYANLQYPEPLTAEDIQQQVLDDETVLLVYSLGEERSFLWLVSSTEIKSYQLPKREEIEQLSQSFLAEIESKAVVPPSGEELSQVLLSPVINQLGDKRLVIVGDGILQTVPFAALPIPDSLNSRPLNAPKPPIMGALIDGDFEKVNSFQISQVNENLKTISSPQTWGARGAIIPKSMTSRPLNPPIMGDFELISETLQTQTKGDLKTLNSPQTWGARGAKLISTEGEGSLSEVRSQNSSPLLGGSEGGFSEVTSHKSEVRSQNASPLLGGSEGGQKMNSSLLSGGTEGGYTPLIVQHEIITLPSASSLAILREQVQGRTPAPKKVAVIADPVFEENDPRFQADYQAKTETNNINLLALRQSIDNFLGKNFGRLGHTRNEAIAILALVPDDLEQLSLDFNANRKTATDTNLSQYQIVHFATHGLLNETQPELSGLVFSLYDQQGTDKPGFLQLNDIFNLTLSADLVVLSACETGIGQEIRGEGLVSLTRGFMYAGAERLVVSLWAVADSSTSKFMQDYYGKILETGSNPGTAMRETQLEMLESNQYNAPYFWAAFVFQGEWKRGIGNRQ